MKNVSVIQAICVSKMKTLLRTAALPALILGALTLSGCATPPAPRDYSAFKQAKPASLLVLPPINDTPDALATLSVLAQLSYPLAESGFYVLPVSLVDETLKLNGMQTAADWAGQIQQAARARCASTFTTIAEDANSLTFERRSSTCPAGMPLTGLYRIVAGRKSLFMLNSLAMGELSATARQQWLDLLATAHLDD